MQNNIVKKIVNIFNVVFKETLGGMPKSMPCLAKTHAEHGSNTDKIFNIVGLKHNAKR
jgi:hypothetical protein